MILIPGAVVAESLLDHALLGLDQRRRRRRGSGGRGGAQRAERKLRHLEEIQLRTEVLKMLYRGCEASSALRTEQRWLSVDLDMESMEWS